MSQALQQKKTVLVRSVSPEFHRSAATNSEHGEALRLLDPVSYLAVPLMVRDKIVGGLAMVMTSDSERRFTDLDVQLGDDLGQRCAYAIESARLYREVKRAVRERDAFLAVASHELRTPVTSIKAIAELLIRQIESKKALSPEKLERIAKFLNEQSDRLARLVNQLLDVTQIDLGALKLVLKDTDVAALVRNSVDVAILKHPNVTFNLNASGPIQATVDPIRLEQVIVNLIDNAVRHSPESRRVEIEVSAVDEGKKFRVSVRDFGKGIPEDQRDQLFERFDRATRTEYSSGLGLGLYLCKQIMNMHEGQIRVEFPSDGGTKFVITAPSMKSVAA
jgi:signal transduction histidine kinase